MFLLHVTCQKESNTITVVAIQTADFLALDVEGSTNGSKPVTGTSNTNVASSPNSRYYYSFSKLCENVVSLICLTGFQCQICQASFHYKNALQRHMETHNRHK